MKLIVSLLLGLFLCGSAGEAFAQKKTITVMIFRHADRETEIEGDDSEPDISVEGQKRAVRLVKVLGRYKPARIFSTRSARAVQTVTPLSRIANLPVEFYDANELEALVEQILASEDKRRVAVVGHNLTSFALANLFLKESKYRMPPDADYGTVWILRIKNGKVRDRVISY